MLKLEKSIRKTNRIYLQNFKMFRTFSLKLAKQNEKKSLELLAYAYRKFYEIYDGSFSKRAIDVGIAEQHAVTLATEMATQGMVVFVIFILLFYNALMIK